MGLKNKSVRKQDWFFDFYVYKKVLQNNWFLYMNENYNEYHQQKTTCTFYIYKRQNKLQNNLYIQKKHLEKARKFASRFIYKKLNTLRHAICHEIIWSWHLCTKSMTLLVTWRFYKKSQTLRKKQDNLSYVFIWKKNGHFALRNFHKNVEIGQGEGGISIWKNHAICVTFL